MKNVKDILDKKGTAVWSVSPDTTVLDALQMMSEKNVGAVLVRTEESVDGIFSERDYARKVEIKGKTARETRVKDIMTQKVVYAKPGESAEDCMAVMISKRIRHLPVYENEKLIGIISIGDVVKAVIEDKEFALKELENYIVGRR